MKEKLAFETQDFSCSQNSSQEDSFEARVCKTVGKVNGKKIEGCQV
jgi:hypothetical protein